MIPRSFYFVRHGETEWNRQGLLQGHTDIPLNDTGREQARAVIDLFADLPIDRIVTSTLSRARETADIINTRLNKPIIIDHNMRERSFGRIEGMSVTEMENMKNDLISSGGAVEENGYPCPPEAESYAAFKARSISTIAGYLDAHPGEAILFVAHGGIYRVLKRLLFDTVNQSPNVCPFFFDKQGDKWVLSQLTK